MEQKRRTGGDADFDAQDVASFTECTGLKPALTRDDAEDAAAASLYAIHGAADARRTR